MLDHNQFVDDIILMHDNVKLYNKVVRFMLDHNQLK